VDDEEEILPLVVLVLDVVLEAVRVSVEERAVLIADKTLVLDVLLHVAPLIS